MQTVEKYLQTLPNDRTEVFLKLRDTIAQNLPKGFVETIQYGMISYVVPLSLYPQGYHVKEQTPLPFISIANQKNHIAIYHFGLYSNSNLLKWFMNEYPLHSAQKLDMGKSCIRFKQPFHIPYTFIALLCQKMSMEEWIHTYEASRNSLGGESF